MEIQFQGLIAFVSHPKVNPKRLLGVLIKHANHRPGLSVLTTAVDSSETTATGSTSNLLSCYDLSGRIVTSLGLGMPADNYKKVPKTSIGFPQGLTAHGSIAKGKPDNTRFNTVFEFPNGGTLSILEYFAQQGSFNGGAFNCIPLSLSLIIPSNDPVTFFLGDLSTKLVVDGAATVAVTNRDPSGGHHYHGYQNLFNEVISNVFPPVEDGKHACGDTTGKVVNACAKFHDIDVECSPVRFP